MNNGGSVASFCAIDSKPRKWSEAEVAVLKVVSEQAWLAAEKLRRDAELRESEERFAKAFNSSPLAITITSLKTGKLIDVNDTFVKITGFSRSEAVGRSTAELGLWAQDGDREAELAAVVRETRIRDLEYLFRMRDGTEVVGLLSADLIDIGGELCALTVIQDITARVKAEEAVHETAIRYRNLFDSIDEGFCVIEILYDEGLPHDYRYIETNPSFEKHSGMTGVVGKTIRDLFPESADEWVHLFAEVAASGEPIRVEKKVEKSDKWLDVHAFRVGEPNKPQVALLFNDITLKKRTELALRESEERFRLVANSAPVLIWSAGTTIERSWFNIPWLEFTGNSADHEEGSGWQANVHSEDLDRYLSVYSEAFESRREFEIEFRLRRHDGDFRWMLDKGVPRFEADGHFSGYIGSCVDITERKTVERELLESEERRQMAEEAGNVGIWDWDIAAGRTYWSESMWTFYGEKPSTLNPDEEYWSQHLHPNDRERVKTHLRQVLFSDREHFKDEFRIVRHDGSMRWIEAKARVERDEDGKAIRVCGVNIDITDRKETEERVRLSEYQLRVVTNAVPALISYVDNRERYRFVNHKYIEWFGRRPEELIGKKVKDVVGLLAYREIKPRIDEALSGVESTFETVLTYKNAGTRYVHVSLVPDIGIDGSVHGYYGLTHDLTDLKRSEDLLKSSEERMGMLMESFTDYAIFSMDSDGNVDSWNKGAEIIFGYTPEEIIGTSGEVIFTPEDIAHGIPERERQTAQKKGRASDERWHLRKDGSRFFASGVLMPLYVGKRLSGYAKIASDLTEKKRRAEELQRAHDELEMRVKERTKELAESNLALLNEMEEREIAERQRIDLLRRLVSSQEFERRRIARDLHDQLGQRLTALRLKIASLKDSSPAAQDFKARVQRLQEIAERLDSEVSFLAWELRPSALDDLGLTDAIGAFVNEWSKHYEIPADFYSANLSSDRMDRDAETHLYRITQEALNNIAKHAKPTQVTVILERRGENMILIIEDDGIGFEPSLERLPSESGKGLGLVGMRERASLVGGEVEIESAPGKGTTIYVKVPYLM
jgi:PAS domain S-box-containing protein